MTTLTDYISPSSDSRSVVEGLCSDNWTRNDLRQALLCYGEEREELFALARERRESMFPASQVEVRSVIEISNICEQDCNYCSIARSSGIKRYIMKRDVVLAQVDFLYSCGRRVIMLQSGENRSANYVRHVTGLVQEMKKRHADLKIALCIGNLSHEQYRRLRDAGTDRYILKFESSNPHLYSTWKPTDTLVNRLKCLEDLEDLGFQVGSGNMVGLPDQTLDDIVDDLLLLGAHKLSMMSCTVFIPGEACAYRERAKGDVEIALNFMALMRILYPERLMPTTSNLEKSKTGGLLRGLQAGANTVTIHDGTPPELKALFPIYSTRRLTPDADLVKKAVTDAHLDIAAGALI